MVHMMRAAFNQSGFLRGELRRRRLCISIKLLDEGARWLLLLLFFCRYCLLSASLPKISSPALFPETAQRPPAGRTAEQVYLGSPLPRVPPQGPTRQPQAARRRNKVHPRDEREPFIKASLRALSTKVHCLSSTRTELRRSPDAGEGMLADANNSFCAQPRELSDLFFFF